MKRPLRWSSCLVLLSSSALLVACEASRSAPPGGSGAGIGGTAGSNPGDAASASAGVIGDPCSAGSCCVPVAIDTTLTRAYLVGGKLVVDVGVSGTPTIGGNEAWASDAEITADGGAPQVCKGLFSRTADDPGPSFASCALTPPAGLVCGGKIALGVRLTSWAFSLKSPDYPITCETSGFAGAGASIQIPVSCPSCPADPHSGVCDYPRTESCPGPESDGHGIQTVGCGCGPPSAVERRWSCPVF